jgi:hypothetical protein
MAVGRLKLDAPALVAMMRHDSSDQLQKRLLVALEMAVHASGLASPEVSEALATFGAPPAGENLAERLDALASRLDDEYFDAQEAGNDQWSVIFSQARTAAAFRCAIEFPEFDAVCEAIYEAAHAIDDPPAVYNELQAV